MQPMLQIMCDAYRLGNNDMRVLGVVACYKKVVADELGFIA